MKKLVIVLLLVLLYAALPAKSYYAEDYHCRIEVLQGGDLQITEMFRYYFTGGSFSWVNRIIPARRTDGLHLTKTAVKDPQDREINESITSYYEDNDLVVKWSFLPVSEQALIFELEFIADNVCYQENDQIFIEWQPLPSQHDFNINKGKVELILPESRQYDFSIIQPRNTDGLLNYSDNSIFYEFSDIKKNEYFSIGAILFADEIQIDQPRWHKKKYIQQEIYSNLPGFFAIIILFIAALIIITAIGNHKKTGLFTPDNLPPDLYDIHPALVSKLVNNLSSSVSPFAAAFYRLIKSGCVKIEKIKKNKYHYNLDPHPPKNNIDAFLYNVLQKELAKGRNDLKKTFNNLHKYRSEFHKLLLDQLFENHYASEEAHQKLHNLQILLILNLIILLLSFIASILFLLSSFPIVVSSVILFTLTLFFLISKMAAVEILTPQGNEAKYSWKLWKKVMKYKLKKEPASLKPQEFDSVFPYALVMDFAPAYVKHFKKRGIETSDSEVVQAFGSTEAFNGFVAYYVVLSSSSGASGAPGGGGGGASAGGGSASAG